MRWMPIAAVLFSLARMSEAIGQPGTVDVYSANHVLPGCKAFLGAKARTFDEAYNMGACYGVLSALLYSDRQLGICAPRDVTGGQSARVVIAYVEQRPARMHEGFNALALEALRSAWPCS